jgi:colanic acid biosynthesis glycosyl transferase WcaI
MSDLMVLSQKASITDSVLPSKLLTYMASGLPVIASVNSESEAAKFIRNSSGGFVTEAEDERAFAEAVLSLQQQHETRLRMGEAGRRYVEQCCDHSLVLRRFEVVIDSLLNPALPPQAAQSELW